ncbi:DUF2628 domain-containing protein [Martelella radicis]|uniref:DUF2628 domain-containing protein n=1 Tax=Martelella radicis TaxID=1397476 RepID=A0A7W6KGY7_9HYPH|nr:DUF2628 domain-containing protein [Martelella radicis]MBB4121116.1 hypothetical protein [Martelella radicis]
MGSYLVLIAPGDNDPEKIRFVRDRFAWLAFLFGPFWLLANRAWLAGFITLGVSIALGVAGYFESLSLGASAASLALNLLIGFEGREWKALAMERRGFTPDGVIVAPDLETAEAIYFSGRDEHPIFTGFAPGPAVKHGSMPSGIGLMDTYSAR